ncbi:translation initiation factor IF-2 [Candidatus Woesearchaeota archaeon]|nr:translation initiation factor IF-2 [Candidatus Woesearchaeota archaeon]
MIRQPIVTIMGHVDHGKTSILDTIRGSGVAAREAGGITQAIGASIIPLSTIKKVCGALLETVGITLTIPGLLFIDTPGHAAFTNLRKRGGNLADIAILVVDIMDGLKPQTLESIEVLKSYKTPFVIVANKIDTIQGWTEKDGPLLAKINGQDPAVLARFETKLYELIGAIYELGLQAERFDRVSDYTSQIAVIPTSARTGAGIPELLMTLAGLAQRFLEKNLITSTDEPGKGTILEIKEQKGIGKVMDVIVYAGKIRRGDTIVVGTVGEPLVTKVKGLFEPGPLQEMREKAKFNTITEVHASTGVRILANDIEEAVAGMPVVVVKTALDEVKESIKAQVQDILIETSSSGISIKADSLGSLEALSVLLKQQNIPIRRATIGPITKKDIADAEVAAEKDVFDGVILGFNIPPARVVSESVKTLTNSVIYKLIEEYEKWKEQKRTEIQLAELDKITKPCKIKLLKGYVFRQNNPAIVGVEVLAGTLFANTPLMNKDGIQLTTMKGIQHDQKNIEKAEKGKQVAASLPNVTVGRQIHEEDILYSAISESEFRTYKEFKKYLEEEEKEILKEIAEIMRKENPVWGI